MCLRVDLGGTNPVEPRVTSEVDVPTAPPLPEAFKQSEQVTSDSKDLQKIF